DRCYWKSTYLKSLDEPTITAVTKGLAARPSEMTFASIWKFGGQFQRVAPDATAFGDRSMPFMLSLDAIWSEANDDDANIAWARTVWGDMQPHSTGRMYLNFPGLGEGDGFVREAFGQTAFQQLQQVKRKFDPDNIFRMNQNIAPE
ncbi:MAG: hypothetical protein JWL86_734, partial [Rhizobium sp.]|nr:hypothetical protein [Rhizobium sp.]